MTIGKIEEIIDEFSRILNDRDKAVDIFWSLMSITDMEE